MRQRRLTDSDPRRRNPRRGFEMMKMAQAGLDRSRMHRGVGAALTLPGPCRRCDGSAPAARIRPGEPIEAAKIMSKRITAVDNAMTPA